MGADFLFIAVFTQLNASVVSETRLSRMGQPRDPCETSPRQPLRLTLITSTENKVSTARNQLHMDQDQFGFIDESPLSPINLLVCDNESLFREILVSALENELSINVVGAAATGLEAIELSKESKPDVVLMDIDLGDGPNGIKVASDIKKAFPNTGIVVLSAHRDKEFLSSFIEEGTAGWSFLLKQSIADIHSLVRAIESAAAGQVTMDPSVMADLYPRQRSVLERLTHNQLEALMFIASGYADSAISEELEIDEELIAPLLQTVYSDLHIEESESVDQRVQATLLYLQETAQVSQ
jgi:DNA-binding NarL/FixJ family response regulator